MDNKPCRICLRDDIATNDAWHGASLCTPCKQDLLISSVPGEIPALSRIEMYAQAMAKARALVLRL